MSISIELLFAAVVQGFLGFGLIALGWWGLASADRLVMSERDEAEREARRRSYLIGARGCQAIGVLLLIFGIATGVSALLGVEPTFRPQ